MKPENQAVMDGIMKEVKSLTLTQRRALLRAMKNPYFLLLALRLADADEDVSHRTCHFMGALMLARRATP